MKPALLQLAMPKKAVIVPDALSRWWISGGSGGACFPCCNGAHDRLVLGVCAVERQDTRADGRAGIDARMGRSTGVPECAMAHRALVGVRGVRQDARRELFRPSGEPAPCQKRALDVQRQTTRSHSPRALSRTLNRRKPGTSSHWAQPLALRVPLPPRWCRQLLDHPVCRRVRVRVAARRLFPLPPRRHIPVDTPRFELRQVPLIAGSTVSGCAVSFTSSSNPIILPWSLAFDVNSVATIN